MAEAKAPKTIGERVREAREAIGLSQSKLGKKVGTSQATVEKIENNKSKRSRFLPQIFVALNLPLEELGRVPPAAPAPQVAAIPPSLPMVKGAAAFGLQRDLPVYSSAEGGPGGTIFSVDPIDYVVRPDPLANVRDAYAMYVVGESMSPKFEQGDLIWINPTLPYRGGDDVLVYRVVDGQYEAAVKRLRRATADAWLLKQFNPVKDLSLPRREWPTCHVIIGSYSRR